MFFAGKKKTGGHILPVSAAACLLAIAVFWAALDSVSEGTARRQRESLERALNRCVTWCYAERGSYPESLEDMKENYGLAYDEEHFFVDYRNHGGNMLPDITIIEKGS